jgi:hypothetical protein
VNKKFAKATINVWETKVTRGSEKVGHGAMKMIVAKRYDNFNAQRREEGVQVAVDLKAIEDLEKDLTRKDGGK